MTEGLNAFLFSAGCGAFMLFFWDMLGGMRRSFARGVLINTVLDVLWWLVSVSAFLWCLWHTELLQLRFFEAFAVVFGAVIYKITVSGIIKRLFFAFFSAIQKIIQFIFKILLTPGRFLYKILYICIYSRSGKR